jgi:uncharacterized protein YfaS (alpha-2-macroglobulin family)
MRTAHYCYLAVLALFLFSCNRKTVSLSYTNAKGEVSSLGNLTFQFDKDLVKDSLLNIWDSTDYVSFEPRIPGRFRWENPGVLVFSPSKPLLPATNYRAVVNSDVLNHSAYGRIKGGDDISFHTPALQLQDVSALWVPQDEATHTALPQLDLYFNYPITPTMLKERLHVAVDGQPAPFELQTVSVSDKVSLRLSQIRAEDKDFKVSLSVDKGLVPEGGTNGTDEALTFATTIASPFILDIHDVTTDHDGSTGTIAVKTSQQVAPENLASFIRLDPAVKFTAVPTEDGFAITSDAFDAETSYTLHINKGLRGTIGGVLHEDYANNVTFGKMAPSVTFSGSKEVYLSSRGEKNIAVRIVNVAKVKIVVSKIYENNLLAAGRYGYQPREDASEEYIPSDGDLQMGDIVYEKEVDTKSLPRSGNSRVLHVDMDDKLPDFRGIYHIMVRSSDDYWVRDSRFVSLSDIGLMAKAGKDKVLVFANSIKDATPMGGVNIVAYGLNNQVLGVGATNAQGVAEIACGRKEFAGFAPAMIIARTAADFNYLPFATTQVNTSRFEVGGRSSNPSGLDAFIYPERDIYRPGEQAHFAVVVRTTGWQLPGELPLKMKFLLPNGKELKTFRKSIDEQGALDGSVDIPEAAVTGSYTLEVYTSNDVLLGSRPFRVEEFVPDRIKVTAHLDKEVLLPGETAHLDVTAENFFGPPAANRNYECEIQVAQVAFSPRAYGRYDFGLAGQDALHDKVEREGKTDEAGHVKEAYAVPDMYKNIGKLRATFFTTIFDETGRPVSRASSADIFTQPVFFGVLDDGYDYYPQDQVVRFPLIALNTTEQVAKATAKIEVIKHEYRTVLSKSGDYFRYESQKEDRVITSQTLAVSGEQTVFPFMPRSPGEYELRVYVPGSNSYVSKRFYSYGSWGGDDNAFEVDKEGQIGIEADKATYHTGETAKVLFKTPFSGRMLVTMETADKVVSYQYVDVKDRSASLDLPLTKDHLPNVFVTATLFKPHGVSDIPLTVAHGFKGLPVEETDRHLSVVINAPQKVRSNTHPVIHVKAEPNSMITLAAVDNGILQVTDFKTPDPYAWFYAPRALEVKAYDIYPLLFPEVLARLSSTGGDGGLEMEKRVNPMPAKRFKLVSYWSGVQKTDGSGDATFTLDIPTAFSGEIRLMAVSCKGQAFGAGEASMKVADPLVLSSALPRFLSPGDTVTMPVTVTNTTNKTAGINATLQLSGPVAVVGSSRGSTDIPPGAEGRVVFTLAAQKAIHTAKVTVSVQGLGEQFTDETEISVRPASTLQKMSGSGLLGPGAHSLTIGTGDFIPGSTDYHLVMSRSPAIRLGNQLQYLVEYPYGCTEQTVSIAFPQLYYDDLASLMHFHGQTRNSNAAANVLEAIRKIKMRQLYNGGITLWDGEDTENWWATVYAAHFLLEAQKSGYDVDKSLLETTLAYLNGRLRNKSLVFYMYNGNQEKKIVPKEVAYSLYVLALAGRPNVSAMNYYKANTATLALDSRYILAATYALAGDKTGFQELLPTAWAGEQSVAETGGSFYSDIRDEAIALDVLLDVDPRNPQVGAMARQVSDRLAQRSWYSTQECAFGFLALGKLARASAQSTAIATVKAGGRTIGTVEAAPAKWTAADLHGTQLDVDVRGTGDLYYWWQAEGISATGAYKEEDSYLRARRKFFDRFGHEISGNTFHQNDLVIVQLTLENTYSGGIDNIVLTDLLPAGFEIENPRTKDIPGMDWIKNASEPTAMDVRDDRINLFVNLGSQRQVYYYAVRAVSPGVYHMGPVSADAMYNGDYHSYNGAGTIVVKP